MTSAELSYFDSGRDELHAGYSEALRKGGLVVQRCTSCSATYSPPVVRCPACGSSSLSFVNAADGTVRAIVAGSTSARHGASVIVEVEGVRIDDDRAPRVGLVSAG
jgi:uncharacterized OB-fold protein